VGRRTIPGGTSVEDHPCTATHKQFKKTLPYIIDDFRELHKKSELKIVKFGYVRCSPK
jgi:hypothetical protein